MQVNSDLDRMAKSLRRLSGKMPRSVETRIGSSLNHFEKSIVLRDIDLEMASFRAICGEEEASSAVISALHHRKYENANRLNIRSHQHKWAIIACMIALSLPLQTMLGGSKLQIDFANGRIDLKIPLSNFGVSGGDTFELQPVEPLDFVHAKDGIEENYLFEEELAALAVGMKYDSIKELVKATANSRNQLLYASDKELPESKATSQDLDVRRSRAMALLVIAVMILQSNKKMAMVRQALPAILKVIGKLPNPIAP